MEASKAAELFRLDGQVALVTGASRGIGEATAKLLAAQGATVIVASRKLESLERVRDEIRADGGKAEAMACHTGDLAQVRALFEGVRAGHGRLDVLVNNAATNPHFGSVMEVDESIWDKTAEVNLKGYFFMCQQGARLMLEGGGGRIVNVSSVNGVSPPPMQGVYSITKAGVLAMTKSFARELGGRGVRVNAILPGLTDTKFASALTQNEQILKNFLALVPMRRMAMPAEMAGPMLFLASEASSYVNGASLVVDGGYLI